MKAKLKAQLREMKEEYLTTEDRSHKYLAKLQALVDQYRESSKADEFEAMVPELKSKADKLASKLQKHFGSQKKRARKAEQKAAQKKEKQVKFNEEANETLEVGAVERKWNDSKGMKNQFVQGKFQVAEIKRLMQALCEYAQLNNLGAEGLRDLCSRPAKEISAEYKKAWCKVAEALPTRSVQSIHNFCRRRFNPDNYSGKWSQQEEEALLDLTQQLGHQWKTIARVLNDQFNSESRARTAENVKDKFKQMGAENAALRVVGKWTLAEEIQLIQSIEKATQI